MNKKTKFLKVRITALAIVLLVTLAALVGCGSSASTGLTVRTITPVAEDQASLNAEQLNNLANMLKNANGEKYEGDKIFKTQELLVAASRGYNMLDPSFNDAAVDPSALGTGNPVEIVKGVIAKANTLVDETERTPVDYSAMNEHDLRLLVNSFKTTVDLNDNGGFFDKLLCWIGIGLQWMTNTLCFGSYLVGICLFAVIVEILMLPFAIKQQKNSIRQATLRPKEMAIRNKYKGRNDQVTMQKMQQELNEFYQKENFSPYSGCLQLLIQMPIIMALYNIIIDPLHYVLGQVSTMSTALNTYFSAARAAGGLGRAMSSNGTIGYLSELKGNDALLDNLRNFAYFDNGEQIFSELDKITAKIPDFTIGSVNLGLTPGFDNWILLLVPVLTFVTYFFTSKITRKFTYQPAVAEGADNRQVACSNTMMDVTMPLMSTVFTFMVPALVGVYWVFRSLVGLLKQFIMSRLMPLPVFTEEDYKAAAKEMAGKKVVVKSANAGRVRSLHHIDDEDFEDTRERALARKAAMEEAASDQAEQKGPVSSAPIKDDNRAEKKNNRNETKKD